MPDEPACELTILMPCLNEAETLQVCIEKANGFLSRSGVVGEVLIADNGSTDGSQEIARRHGARVVDVPIRGYGAALNHGIRAARGRYVIMGDSDDSYDFTALDPFVAALREGNDLVMGNRFKGGIKPGAMPKLHRYLGNPVLTFIGRLFFRSPSGDFHCGLRGFRRDAILGLALQAPGMEFASEMVVKATIAKLRIAEVPTTLSPDGRSRPPHLRSWRDGWRHLRFMLLFSPRWLFLYPGFALFLSGLLVMAWLEPGTRVVLGASFDIHTLVFAAFATIVGFQTVFFWVFAKVLGTRELIVPRDPQFERVLAWFGLEPALIAGGLAVAAGLVLSVIAVGGWFSTRFGALSPEHTMRLVVPAVTLLTLGIQTIYSAFFLSFLSIKADQRAGDGGNGR